MQFKNPCPLGKICVIVNLKPAKSRLWSKFETIKSLILGTYRDRKIPVFGKVRYHKNPTIGGILG